MGGCLAIILMFPNGFLISQNKQAVEMKNILGDGGLRVYQIVSAN